MQLLEGSMPAFDFAARHGRWMRAPRRRVWEALRSLDLGGSRAVRLLYRLRGMPSRALTLEGLLRTGFILLGEVPGEELVLGVAGRFWTPRGALVRLDAEGFRAFARPGFAKAVWGFHLRDEEGGTQVTTETRILCTDAASRRRFRLYWMLVRPGSGCVRRAALAELARRTERV